MLIENRLAETDQNYRLRVGMLGIGDDGNRNAHLARQVEDVRPLLLIGSDIVVGKGNAEGRQVFLFHVAEMAVGGRINVDFLVHMRQVYHNYQPMKSLTLCQNVAPATVADAVESRLSTTMTNCSPGFTTR